MPRNVDDSQNRKLTLIEIVNQLGAAQGAFSVSDVTARTGTSRQAVHRHLAGLVRAGVLEASGKARATRYRLTHQLRAVAPPRPFSRSYAIAGLREDEVWKELRASLPALGDPRYENAEAALAYAVTEMVNNAIDHARAAEVSVRAGWGRGPLASANDGDVWFEVSDQGIGAFENVRATLGLPDHLAALQEISKGKRSTQPQRHSGEGLFFTSKIAAHFELEANGLEWIVDNRRGDAAIAAAPARPGTTVRFVIAQEKTERLEDLFARYTHDFEFDTTRTVVKLFEYGVRFVSRSEAKRLVEGLERFAHVIMDFRGVESVGQGFADEVFRVWARAHPEVTLATENMSPLVAFMVQRAQHRV